MANIIASKELNDIDLAYGKNIVTLTDTDSPAITSRFVIQVKDSDDNLIGDVRQLPNLAGYAHFDLQNILKNQVTHNPALEVIQRLSVSANEIFPFTIEYGYVDAGAPVTSTLPTSGEYIVLNGRKPHTEIDWDYSEYAPTIQLIEAGPGGFTNLINSVGKALTDRHIESTTFAAITDGKPAWANTNRPIWKINRRKEDHYTLSFLNAWIPNPSVGVWTNGINRFRVSGYNGSTLLFDTTINNVIGNGGGPNTNLPDEFEPTGEYRVISIQVGDLLSEFVSYPDMTHFYVAADTYIYDPDVASGFGLMTNVYRLDIDNGECNDFDPIQVSWVNSFGFRDYYTFEKRNDHSVTTQQNTYQQLDADWSGQTFAVESYNRGERVFNKSQTENYTANTRYLTDEESQYLKNLYLSPDVKVRFDGSDEWVPVILTDTQYTERTFRKDRLFQHTINFRLANPQQIQRG